MERDIKALVELYDILTQNGTTEIKEIKDTKQRENLTHRPMDDDGTLNSLKILPGLHSWINLLKWFEHLAYYWLARLFTPDGSIPVRGQGRKKRDGDQFFVDCATGFFRDFAKDGDLGLPLDRPGIVSFETLDNYMASVELFL